MIARDRDRPPRRCLGVVAGESVAERWLRPTLAGVNASWPDIAIDVETAGRPPGPHGGCLSMPGPVCGECAGSRDRVSHCGAARTSVAAPATARKPALLRGWAYLKEVQRILAEVHGVSERPAPLATARADRVGRGRRRAVARAPGGHLHGGAPRRRPRAGNQPPRRRPRPARLRRVARLHRRHRGAAPGDDAARTPCSRTRSTRSSSFPSAAPPCSPRAAGPPARPTSATGRCSTIWAGKPTGRTGAPARARPRRTCRGPRASASTACWSRPR